MPSPLKYTTTSDGYSIAYLVRGTGTPLIEMPCILQGDIAKTHELPANRSLYDPLAARFELVLYDAFGTGNSTRGIGPDHSMLDTQIDLEAVAGAADAASFVLYTHNFSCYTAMRFAGMYPERLKALIMVNPSPLRGDVLMPSWRDFYLNAWPTFIEAFVSTGTPGGDQMRDVLSSSVTQADFIAIANGGVGHAIEDVISAVTVPTLVLASRNYLNPLYMPAAAEVASGVRNGRLLYFDGTKNADFMMTTDGTVPIGVQAILDFLEELGVGEPAVTNGASLNSSGLSQREVEILKLIAAGKRNREIAQDLVISDSTVAKHVSSILSKTDSSNRAEATTFAHTHRLV
nr:LuxR family transcriptional regulator [uncultured bacterium]